MLKILNKGTNSTKNTNSQSIFIKKGNTLGKNNHKNIKKLVHEEESDSEPEIEESQYTPEEEEDIVKEKKSSK